MRKYLWLFPIIVVLFSYSFFAVEWCLANDLGLEYRVHDMWGLPHIVGFVVAFWTTVLSEYVIVAAFLQYHRKAWGKLFLWVLLVNLITNLPAQLWGWFTSGDLNWVPGIEFVVVVVEVGLMTWVFRRMLSLGQIDEPVTTVRTIVMVFVANLVSFCLGILIGGISEDMFGSG